LLKIQALRSNKKFTVYNCVQKKDQNKIGSKREKKLKVEADWNAQA
jgi:hypothetical protein